jgi:hypothetical protein
MEKFYQKGTKYEPEISLNPISGNFRIKGTSMPENTVKTYHPALEWITLYKKNPAPQTNLTFELDYINTASSKMIHEILRVLDDIANKGNSVKIIWHYHFADTDILDIGEEFKDFVKSDFVLQKIDEI